MFSVFIFQISEKIDEYDLGAFDAEKTINELTESALEHIPTLTPPIVAQDVTNGAGNGQTLTNTVAPVVPSPIPNDRPSKAPPANSYRNMRSNSLPVNWQGQEQSHGHGLPGSAYNSQFQNQRPYQANHPAMLFGTTTTNNTTNNNFNFGPNMQQRQNGGRYSYSSNQDFVNYNHNYLNFRHNSGNQYHQMKNNNNQHYQLNNNNNNSNRNSNNNNNNNNNNGLQFHGQGNENGYYDENNATPNTYQRCQRTASGNGGQQATAVGQAATTHGMQSYSHSYYNGGCNNHQCGQQQCGQQHNNNYYNSGYHQNKFNGCYSRSNHHQQMSQQAHQQQQQYYTDLDRKQEAGTTVAADPMEEESSNFRPAPEPQEFDSSNNMVLKDMSTSLSSLYDENTFFQMSTVFSES